MEVDEVVSGKKEREMACEMLRRQRFHLAHLYMTYFILIPLRNGNVGNQDYFPRHRGGPKYGNDNNGNSKNVVIVSQFCILYEQLSYLLLDFLPLLFIHPLN